MLRKINRLLLLTIMSIGVGVHSQSLPKSLFPNQEHYDLEKLLDKSFDFNQENNQNSKTNQWSLQVVVDMALINNLSLAQAKKELDSAKALYTGSIQDFYVPNLSTTLGTDFQNTFTTATSPAVDPAWSMNFTLPSIVLSKTVFNGFATMYAHRIAKENYLNAQNTYTNKMREIIYETTIRYYDQFLKQEEVNVSLKQLRQLKDQLEQAEINFRNGRVSDFDVSLSRSQFYAAQPVYFNAEKNRVFSQEDFFRYIGYKDEPDTYVKLQGELLTVTNMKFSEFDESNSLEFILSNDTALATLRSAYNNAKSQKGQQNSLRLPKVNVQFDYTPMWGRDKSINNFSQSSYQGSYGVAASIQVPILEWIPGTGVASKVKSAQENIVRSQYALLDAEEQKLIEVKNILLSIRELAQSVDAFRISEQQAGRASEIAQEQYRFGRISVLELNQAQVDYIDAKRKLLNAVYNELKSKLYLQQAINNLPSFIEEINKIQNIEE